MTNNKNKLNKIITGVLMLALAFVFVPQVSMAKNNNGNNGNGHAWGHLHAPGWIKKHGNPNITADLCNILPRGIAKKLNACNGLVTPDTTAPVISNARATDITSTGANIRWNTNESANSTVWYSSSTPVNTDTATKLEGASFVKTHNVSLSGLTADTTYYVIVGSADKAGNMSKSSEFSFKTLVTAVNPPVINSAQVSTVTDTSATLIITTNEDVKVSVTYHKVGSSTNTTVVDNDFDDSHTMVITGLTADSTYNGVVTVTDHDNNSVSSGTIAWTTLDVAVNPPVINSFSVATVTDTTSTLIINTNENVKVDVAYNVVGSGTILHKIDNTMDDSHTLVLTDLSVNTSYNAKATVTDSDNHSVMSSTITFTTTNDITGPVISSITEVESAINHNAIIGWTTNENANSVIEFSTTSGFDAGTVTTFTNGTMVMVHSMTIPDLLQETTYYYKIKSTDGAGNTTTSSTGTIFIS